MQQRHDHACLENRLSTATERQSGQRRHFRDVENIFHFTSVDWRAFQHELLINENGYHDLLRSDSLIVMLYKTSIILWPTYEHAMNNLANVLRKRKQPQFHMEAKELLVKALEINSKFSAAWMNLGIVQAQLDEYKAAEDSYKNAISLRKDFYPDAHFNLGTLYCSVKIIFIRLVSQR